MKKNYWKTISLSFYLIFVLIACQEPITQEPKPKSLQLPQLQADSIIIFGQSDYFDKAYELYEYQIITPNGATSVTFDSALQFKHKFESDRPVIIKFATFGRNKAIPIFALPGDSIKIDINFIDFLNARQTQQFSGSSVLENTLLSNLKKYLVLDNNNYNYEYDTDVSGFLRKLDTIQNTANLLKHNAIKYEGLKNPYFIDAYNTFLKYKLATFLKRYPIVYERSLKLGEPVLNEEYHRRLENIFQENPEHLGIYPYTEYLSTERGINQNNLFGKQIGIEPPLEYLVNAFHTIDSLFTAKEIIDHQKLTVVISRISYAEFRRKSSERIAKAMPSPPSGGAPQINKRNLNKDLSKSFNKFFGKDEIDGILELYQQTNPPKKYFEIVKKRYNKLME